MEPKHGGLEGEVPFQMNRFIFRGSMFILLGDKNAVVAAQPIKQPKHKSHTVQIQCAPFIQEIQQLQCHKVFFTMQQGPFRYQLK